MSSGRPLRVTGTAAGAGRGVLAAWRHVALVMFQEPMQQCSDLSVGVHELLDAEAPADDHAGRRTHPRRNGDSG